jgi:hypothetical protein
MPAPIRRWSPRRPTCAAFMVLVFPCLLDESFASSSPRAPAAGRTVHPGGVSEGGLRFMDTGYGPSNISVVERQSRDEDGEKDRDDDRGNEPGEHAALRLLQAGAHASLSHQGPVYPAGGRRALLQTDRIVHEKQTISWLGEIFLPRVLVLHKIIITSVKSIDCACRANSSLSWRCLHDERRRKS